MLWDSGAYFSGLARNLVNFNKNIEFFILGVDGKNFYGIIFNSAKNNTQTVVLTGHFCNLQLEGG
jgi:hypothetical protein